MKKYCIGVALFAFNVAMLGITLPYLISYANTEMVIVGFSGLMTLPAINYFVVKTYLINKR